MLHPGPLLVAGVVGCSRSLRGWVAARVRCAGGGLLAFVARVVGCSRSLRGWVAARSCAREPVTRGLLSARPRRGDNNSRLTRVRGARSRPNDGCPGRRAACTRHSGIIVGTTPTRRQQLPTEADPRRQLGANGGLGSARATTFRVDARAGSAGTPCRPLTRRNRRAGGAVRTPLAPREQLGEPDSGIVVAPGPARRQQLPPRASSGASRGKWLRGHLRTNHLPRMNARPRAAHAPRRTQKGPGRSRGPSATSTS